MDRFFTYPGQKRTQILSAIIASLTIIVLALNSYALMIGITNVLPHLFYVPIILTAYYFPRRGILFAIIISAIYCGMSYFFNPVISEVLLSAGGRAVIFILIGAIVSLLTTRLQESENRFRGVAERSSDIILLSGTDGRVSYVSPSVEKILGYRPTEIEGKELREFIHPEDPGLVQASARKCGGSEGPDGIMVRFRKKDGTWACIEFFVSPMVKGGTITGIQTTGRDVTERKRAADEQKIRDDLLNAILESMIAGVVLIDPDNHTIVDVNAVAAAMFGAEKKEIIGSVCTSYICPALEGACPITDLHQVVDRSEKILLRSDLTKCPILKSVTPITLRDRTYLLESFIDISELARAKDALLESEEKYRLLADFTYDWEYWIGPDESILYTTPSCERITGYTPEEFYTNRRLIDTILHPEDRDAHEHHMSHFFVPEKPEAVDFRIIRRDGSIRWIGHVCQPLYNAQGEFIGRRASNRDITERKRAEEAYRETSRRLAEIIDFLPDPTMVINREGIVVAWNRAMEKMSGIPVPDILGKGDHAYTTWIAGRTGPILIDYVLRQDNEGIRTAYPHAHFEGNMVRTETDITRTDGTRFSLWISAIPLIDQEGEITGAIESVRDVTEQKKVQRALQESNVYLDTIINTLADPLFIKDRTYRFVRVNNSFCQFTGHSREDILGKTDYDLFRKEEADVFRTKDEEIFRTGLENENEESITTGLTKNTRTISTKKSIYTNSSGEEFIVGIIRDISGRKLEEEALHQANRKLNLLSGITRHDINNQLAALSAYLELSRESLNNPVLTAEFIAKEEKITETIVHQINFTKDYEDMGVKAPQWQNVNRVIRSVTASLPVRNISIDAGDPSLEVFADPLLEKMFYNIIDNALRYGGEQMTAIRVTSSTDNDELILVVDDDGTGISADDKKKLFTRGFGKHTGLGLYLSREILAITGITITETGTPGRGARFEIRVPKGVWRFS